MWKRLLSYRCRWCVVDGVGCSNSRVEVVGWRKCAVWEYQGYVDWRVSALYIFLLLWLVHSIPLDTLLTERWYVHYDRRHFYCIGGHKHCKEGNALEAENVSTLEWRSFRSEHRYEAHFCVIVEWANDQSANSTYQFESGKRIITKGIWRNISKRKVFHRVSSTDLHVFSDESNCLGGVNGVFWISEVGGTNGRWIVWNTAGLLVERSGIVLCTGRVRTKRRGAPTV